MSKPRYKYSAASHINNAGVTVIEIGVVYDYRRCPCFAVVFAYIHDRLAERTDVTKPEA